MIRFDSLFSRADTALLQEILGKSTVRLLAALDERNVNPSRLRELVSELKSQTDLLNDPSIRRHLLDLLKPAEALDLCTWLQVQPGADPYTTLQNLSFSDAHLISLICFLGLPSVIEAPPERLPEQHEITPVYGLFEHQRRVVKFLQSLIAAYPHRAVLHMPTGSGKTRTMMSLIAEHLRSHEPTLVVWLASSEELCEQAASEFEKAWTHIGDRPLSVYRMWGGRRISIDALSDGLLVAGLASVYQACKRDISWSAWVGDRTSLVVMDEAHQAIAPTYEQVVQGLLCRNLTTALVGLTATPGRTWNDVDKDARLAAFFARNKATLSVNGYGNPVEYLIDQGYLARPIFRSLTSDTPALTEAEKKALASELEIPYSILKKLAEDELRSVRIIREVERLAQSHRRILLFATTVQHAELLAPVLSAMGIPTRAITATTPTASRAAAISWYKSRADEVRVLANYGVLTTGFDAPQTSAALIARPTRSLVLFSQMVGRATRGTRAGGNTVAEIVTVVDTTLPGFGDMSEAFLNWEDVW